MVAFILVFDERTRPSFQQLTKLNPLYKEIKKAILQIEEECEHDIWNAKGMISDLEKKNRKERNNDHKVGSLIEIVEKAGLDKRIRMSIYDQ